MATDLETGQEASVTQLVSGIMSDAQKLTRQQLALLRYEVKEDLHKAREAGFFLAWGLGTALMGALLFCLMLVHLLSWTAPELPLWGCYGIVGGLVAALGSALFFAGIHKVRSFDPPLDQSVQALKENVQWLTKSR
jgi:Putative Actinobacterial Holin-X, holin superfamily III